MEDPVYILVTKLLGTLVWGTAIKKTANCVQSWQKPAYRHMKVAAFVSGQALPSKNNSSGRPNSDNNEGLGGMVVQQSRPSFHPIHCAASQGMVSAARLLLKQCNSGQATCGKDERLCDLLDASGRSPLHWAAIMGHTDVISLLLEHGASLDCRDPSERTPLFSSAACGSVAAVRLLLQRGADQNAQDERGLTPLHAAASGGHLEVASALLSARADPRAQAVVGATPRHIAERHGHATMVELLVAAERRAGIAGARVGVAGSTSCLRKNSDGKESFLTQLRRGQRAAMAQSA